MRKQIGFEQHFERTHLPQSVVIYGISDMGIPTGDAHITRDLGMGMPKTRGCPNHCDSGETGKLHSGEIECVIE